MEFALAVKPSLSEVVMIDPLNPELLYGACDLRQFSFQTTDELESLPEIVGQSRVVDAVQFGVGIQPPGF